MQDDRCSWAGMRWYMDTATFPVVMAKYILTPKKICSQNTKSFYNAYAICINLWTVVQRCNLYVLNVNDNIFIYTKVP